MSDETKEVSKSRNSEDRNAMAKGKGTKRQTMVDKIVHRKSKMWHSPLVAS